jgi:hypothetical protein
MDRRNCGKSFEKSPRERNCSAIASSEARNRRRYLLVGTKRKSLKRQDKENVCSPEISSEINAIAQRESRVPTSRASSNARESSLPIAFFDELDSLSRSSV